MIKLITILILLIFSQQIQSCLKRESPTLVKAQINNYEIKKILPKEKRYTQGLFFSEDSKYLYESGGLYSKSTLVKFEYPSFQKVKEIKLKDEYFAEGIAKCGEFLYQLTWRENTILKYAYPDMKFIEGIPMPKELSEGWGLTSSDKENELLATNGSNNIFRLDCNNNLQIKSKISVTNKSKPIKYLNDIEYANNFIWANVYLTTKIIKIDPVKGSVINEYDMRSLANYEIAKKTLSYSNLTAGDVLNGICYDKVKGTFLISGKQWGHFYEVIFK